MRISRHINIAKFIAVLRSISATMVRIPNTVSIIHFIISSGEEITPTKGNSETFLNGSLTEIKFSNHFNVVQTTDIFAEFMTADQAQFIFFIMLSDIQPSNESPTKVKTECIFSKLKTFWSTNYDA